MELKSLTIKKAENERVGWAYLTRIERNIIIERRGFADGVPKTLGVVGECYGVTRDRIKTMERRAMEKLDTIDELIDIGSKLNRIFRGRIALEWAEHDIWGKEKGESK